MKIQNKIFLLSISVADRTNESMMKNAKWYYYEKFMFISYFSLQYLVWLFLY